MTAAFQIEGVSQYIKINNVILTCIQVLVNQTSCLESSQSYYQSGCYRQKWNQHLFNNY